MRNDYEHFELKRLLLKFGDLRSTGLLTNQGSFSLQERSYLFELLDQEKLLKRLFLPEHGLFAELQDQIPLEETDSYKFLNLAAEIVSLYGNSEDTLVPSEGLLTDLLTLVIDIQDVGSRYYTFATTVSYIIELLANHPKAPAIIILDRPNPAGRQVEGTPLAGHLESFVGRPGVLHRHGLTIGELALYYYKKFNAGFHMVIIGHDKTIVPKDLPESVMIIPGKSEVSPETNTSRANYNVLDPWVIAPSPNMPGPITPLLYSGQCLLEGTNISEGRGTTRPFEIFGAPWITGGFIENRDISPFHTKGAVLRPLKYIPTFHKYIEQTCYGYQIQLNGEPYHSLLHTLEIIEYLKRKYPNDFGWRSGAYEFRSERPAIDLLAGDDLLIDYINHRTSLDNIRDHIKAEEKKWIDECQNILLYREPLFSIL